MSVDAVDTLYCIFFFFNDTATTEIYTLSLHDALPIYVMRSDDAGDSWHEVSGNLPTDFGFPIDVHAHERDTIFVVPIKSEDRKSTRLNSSHGYISYAVFCLKKKKPHITHPDHLSPHPS